MGRTLPYVRGLAFCVVAVAAELTAHAEPARDQAAALELFNRAKELQATGDWTSACAKFEASMALNPAVGTQTRLARCNVHHGKLARAWSDYLAALNLNRTLSGQSAERTEELRRLIETELAALAPRVPKLRLVIRDAPHDLRVFRDGAPFPPAALGDDLPVDPGKIEILVEAPGYIAVRREVAAVEGEVAVVEIVLQAAPVLPVIPPAPSPLFEEEAPTPARRLDVATAPNAPTSLGGRRVAALIVGGAGVVGIGVATGLGIDAINKATASSPYCTPTETCKATGLDLLTQARHVQAGAFVSLALGGALATTGVVLWFTAPRSPNPAAARPAVTVGHGVVKVGALW